LTTWPHLLNHGSVFLASSFGVRMFKTLVFLAVLSHWWFVGLIYIFDGHLAKPSAS